LLELYLGTTVLVFFFGPVDWHVPDATKLLAFLSLNYGGLWFGYRWGIRRGKIALRRSPVGDVGVIRMPRQLMWLITFSMAFTIASNLVRLYAIRGDPGTFVSSFLHPGEAYRAAQLLAQMDREGSTLPISGFSWPFRISTVLAVFNGLYFPLALICWRRLRVPHRLMFFAAVLSAILFTVGIGAQSGIGFLVFAAVPVVLYRIYVAGTPITGRSTSRILAAKKRGSHPALAKVLLVGSLCALVATVVFFQLSRAEESGQALDAVKDLGGQFGSPAERGIVPVTGGRLNYGLVMTCMYVSHGYEGLALSMELPFQWTYGLGWSKALQVIIRDYLGGPDLSGHSYLIRNAEQNGWPNPWWSTIFAWIASDTTYYGTVLFTCLVGFVIARWWVDVIAVGNPVGFAVLAQMFTLVFMFPANNALAQTLEALFSLVGVFCIYALSRQYFRPIRRAPAGGQAAADHCCPAGPTEARTPRLSNNTSETA
jgi:hypothetical protein